MKTPTMFMLAAFAAISSSHAATFIITGGTTSVDLDDPLLGTIGWSVTGAAGTVVGAPGFDVGFSILPASTFSYDDAPFAINGGDILHSGTITLTSDGTSVPAGAVTVGDFTITSALDVVDTFTTGQALFSASATGVDTSTPGSIVVTGDLLITDALSSVLVGNNSLTGTDAGDFQVSGVPEPSGILLGGVATIALAMRRRRR